MSTAAFDGLSQEELDALGRAADCLDLNIDGLTAIEVAQRYRALGCQITDEFAARLTNEWAAAHSGYGQVAVGQLDEQQLPVAGNEGNDASVHTSILTVPDALGNAS